MAMTSTTKFAPAFPNLEVMAKRKRYRANCSNSVCAFHYESTKSRNVASQAAAHQAQTGHRVNVVAEPVK